MKGIIIFIALVVFFSILGSCGSESTWYTDSNGNSYNQDGYYDDNGNGHYDEDDLYGNGKYWNYLD